MAILLNVADCIASRFFAVIFGLVPKILVQRVTNQVNKFTSYSKTMQKCKIYVERSCTLLLLYKNN